MEKQEFLKKYNLTESQFSGHEKIDCSLDLGSLTSIPDGFNPTVGGYLDLGSLTSIPDGFNPTVGGSLYLENESIRNNSDVSFLSWQDGKYILVDGEFTEVLNKRGNIFKVKHVNKNKEFYCVTDGNGRYAHGDTIKEAKDDLIYKISNRSKSDYDDLCIADILKFEDAIECYRVITGSCSAGVRNFIQSNNLEKKEYSVSEIIDITNGAYGGNAFESFFKNK